MYRVQTSQILKCTIKLSSVITVFICVHHDCDHHEIKWGMRSSLMLTPIQRTSFRNFITITFSCYFLFLGYIPLWKSDENYFQKTKYIYIHANKILFIVSGRQQNKWNPSINFLMIHIQVKNLKKKKLFLHTHTCLTCSENLYLKVDGWA